MMEASDRRGPLPPSGPDSACTSIHIARARGGDAESRAWIVARLMPFLRLQAAYRLRGPLRRLHDPEDLVQDVWAAVLPRLDRIEPRDGRFTPVLLKYLGVTLLRRVNDLLKKQIRRARSGGAPDEGTPRLDDLPAEITDVRARAERDEVLGQLRAALDRLGPREREILVLRAIEQVSNGEVARLLGLAPSAVAMRFRRALDKLRAALPDPLLLELEPD
jgi:RNA polymerase sigma-70 factor (ECF subfamily)